MNENKTLKPETIKRIRRVMRRIDAANETIGNGAAYLVLAMAVLTFLIVILRYAFDLGWVAMQETVMYMHAAFFMLVMGYALRHDAHVRIDIFFQELSAERKALVEFWGTVLILYPVCGFIFYYGFGYALDSWLRLESSPEAGGLPLVFVLKSLLVAMPVLLFAQGTSRLLGAILVLRGGESVDVLPSNASPGAQGAQTRGGR